jgi:hypothetical protein
VYTMIMKTLSIKHIVAICLLLIALFTFLAARKIENEIIMWVSPCKIEDNLLSDSIIQIEDIMYIAEPGKTISVLKSYDGCTWVEIESSISDHDAGFYSVDLFRSPDNQLGIVWEADRDKKPRSTFFWSIFDGSTWSEPIFLFQRDEPCNLNDAIMLEDGALLVMWNESLVYYSTLNGRTVRGSGCVVVYRAYIGNGGLFTEKVIEPENPKSCYARGYSFIDDGEYIWCVFKYSNHTDSFYKSWSKDGKNWSSPEPFRVPVSTCRTVILTPEGEIGIFEYNLGEKSLFLAQSADWKKWSKNKIFNTKTRITGVDTAGGNDRMWGLLDTEDGLFFIHAPEESAGENSEIRIFVKPLYFLSFFCFFVAFLLLFFILWKKKSESV